MAYVSKEHSKKVKATLSKEFPAFKFSVTVKHYSKLDVIVLSGPLMLTDKANGYEQINRYSFDRHNAAELYSPEVLAFWKRVYEIANEGNYNNSDAMVDYFDVGFYLYLEVGKWDKPFIYTGPAPAPAAQVAEVTVPVAPVEVPAPVQILSGNTVEPVAAVTVTADAEVIINAPILEPYLQQAISAHNWTSFTPDKRGRSLINEHSAELENDLASIPQDYRLEYKAKYIELFLAWISAKGRCISSMITGPARFPTRRAEKANNAEHSKLMAFLGWREYKLKNIAKQVQAALPQETKDNRAFAALKNHITRCAKVIAGIDAGTERGCSRPLFVSSISNKIETVANAGNADLLTRCLDLLKQLNSEVKKPIISEKHKVWSFAVKVEQVREAQFNAANAESKEFEFEGGVLILNYSADRVQISHKEKPASAVLSDLKRNGFKWAPSVKAWQRKLTGNGIYAAAKLTGIPYETIK